MNKTLEHVHTPCLVRPFSYWTILSGKCWETSESAETERTRPAVDLSFFSWVVALFIHKVTKIEICNFRRIWIVTRFWNRLSIIFKNSVFVFRYCFLCSKNLTVVKYSSSRRAQFFSEKNPSIIREDTAFWSLRNKNFFQCERLQPKMDGVLRWGQPAPNLLPLAVPL